MIVVEERFQADILRGFGRECILNVLLCNSHRALQIHLMSLADDRYDRITASALRAPRYKGYEDRVQYRPIAGAESEQCGQRS